MPKRRKTAGSKRSVIDRSRHSHLQWPQPDGEGSYDYGSVPPVGTEDGFPELPWGYYRVSEYIRQRLESTGLLDIGEAVPESINIGSINPLSYVEGTLLDSQASEDSTESAQSPIKRFLKSIAGNVRNSDNRHSSDLFELQANSEESLRVRTFFRNLLSQAKIEFEDRYKFPKVSTARPSDYTLLKTIGKGSFGKVFLVTQRKNGEPFALKTLEKSHVVREKQIAHTLSEKRILASVRFPFLCYLIQHFKDNANLYMVLPFCNGGDLFGHLVKTRSRFKEDQARFFVSQIVLAFEYLHFNHVIFRDLKPENIMLESTGYLKLSDFGFAKIVKGRTWTLCGTPEYLAPELIFNKGYGKSVDWWGVGVLTYELNTGVSPFYTSNTSRMYEKILSGKYKKPKHFGKDLRDFVGRLLVVSPVYRLGNSYKGVNEIKLHPWFKSVDWISLYRQELTPPYVPKLSGPMDTRHFDKYKELPLKTAKKNLYEREFRKF